MLKKTVIIPCIDALNCCLSSYSRNVVTAFSIQLLNALSAPIPEAVILNNCSCISLVGSATSLGFQWPSFSMTISPYFNVSKGADQSSIDGGRRLANVLRTAAGLANYGGLLSDGVAQGVAIAGAEERTNPSFSACVADVEVNAEARFFQVKKLTVVIDLALIIYPDGALAQIEGSVLWGLSNGLYEELTYANGKVEPTNFDTYKWQTIVGTPEINIKLLENSNYPSGAGEPATSIVAPAICNAIFAASNVRLRELPITRERFASAIAQTNSGD